MEPDIFELLTSGFHRTPESEAFAEEVQAGPGLLETLSPDVAGLGGLLVSGRHLLKGALATPLKTTVRAVDDLATWATRAMHQADSAIRGVKPQNVPTALEAREARQIDHEFVSIMDMIESDRARQAAKLRAGKVAQTVHNVPVVREGASIKQAPRTREEASRIARALSGPQPYGASHKAGYTSYDDLREIFGEEAVDAIHSRRSAGGVRRVVQHELSRGNDREAIDFLLRSIDDRNVGPGWRPHQPGAQIGAIEDILGPRPPVPRR